MFSTHQMLSRNAVALALLMLCSGCAGNQTHSEADTLPDSEVAFIKSASSKGFMFNERHLFLRYFDGTEDKGLDNSNLTRSKIMPGRHTLGVWVNWGNFCFGWVATGCFNWCYSGLALKAEAGHKYSYDIEKNKDEVNVVLSDETGAVAAKGLCEKIFTWGVPDSSNTPVIKSIIERLERESKELEIQDKAE